MAEERPANIDTGQPSIKSVAPLIEKEGRAYADIGKTVANVAQAGLNYELTKQRQESNRKKQSNVGSQANASAIGQSLVNEYHKSIRNETNIDEIRKANAKLKKDLQGVSTKKSPSGVAILETQEQKDWYNAYTSRLFESGDSSMRLRIQNVRDKDNRTRVELKSTALTDDIVTHNILNIRKDEIDLLYGEAVDSGMYTEGEGQGRAEVAYRKANFSYVDTMVNEISTMDDLDIAKATKDNALGLVERIDDTTDEDKNKMKSDINNAYKDVVSRENYRKKAAHARNEAEQKQNTMTIIESMNEDGTFGITYEQVKNMNLPEAQKRSFLKEMGTISQKRAETVKDREDVRGFFNREENFDYINATSRELADLSLQAASLPPEYKTIAMQSIKDSTSSKTNPSSEIIDGFKKSLSLLLRTETVGTKKVFTHDKGFGGKSYSDRQLWRARMIQDINIFASKPGRTNQEVYDYAREALLPIQNKEILEKSKDIYYPNPNLIPEKDRPKFAQERKAITKNWDPDFQKNKYEKVQDRQTDKILYRNKRTGEMTDPDTGDVFVFDEFTGELNKK